MNLLLNARDAISAAERIGKIEIVAAETDSNHVRIQIIDNGIGIPYQHRDLLFHPFFTTKPTGTNLGLGLYTCRAVVETHQGQIEIESLPDGPGTIVTVILPVSADPT